MHHPLHSTSDNHLGPLNPLPRRPQPRMALALILAQPRLQRIPQLTLPHKVNNLPEDNKHKRNRIHPMDAQVKNFDPNRNPPKTARQQRDIEKRRARQAKQQGREAVKQREYEGVPREIAADLRIPRCAAETRAVENARLRAHDEHAPPGELADDLIQRALCDEELFKDVAEAVEGGAEQGEEVALDGVGGAKGVGACDVVGGEDDAEPADAQQYAEDLRVVVAHAQEEEGDCDDDYNGPEVDELRGENGCLASPPVSNKKSRGLQRERERCGLCGLT